MSNYASQYSDPRWLELRQYVVDGNKGCCAMCGFDIFPLQAHHLYYRRGKKVWEYDPTVIVPLCSNCHEIFHEQVREFWEDLGSMRQDYRILSRVWSLLRTIVADLSDFRHTRKRQSDRLEAIERAVREAIHD